MKTVVITGCAGLIGSHFSRHLLNRGYRVVGIDDLSGGYEDYLPDHDNFEFYQFGLSNRSDTPDKLNHIFSREKPAACYHFAAYAAEGLSPFVRHFNYTNNVLSSVNVINQCIQSRTKLIFTSSMAVYGSQQVPFVEDMTPSPIDPYGIAKYAVEMDIQQANIQFGLPYNIVRPHNVIGIYQNIWDRYRNVIGIFIRRVLDNKPMLIYGDGEQTRAFSDIKYYMAPLEKLLDDTHNSEIFNLGSDKYYSINELADIVKAIASKYNYNATSERVESRHEARHAYCDHTKAQSLSHLGFTDNTILEDLVDEMFIWSMDQPKREMKTMDYEIEDGIYGYWK